LHPAIIVEPIIANKTSIARMINTPLVKKSYRAIVNKQTLILFLINQERVTVNATQTSSLPSKDYPLLQGGHSLVI
jgi:hypothetical protein